MSFEHEMRSVGPRLPLPPIRALGQRKMLIAFFPHDGSRAVAITRIEHDEIHRDPGRALGLALMGKQRHLLGSVVRQRAPLSIVGGEQSLSRLPAQDGRELPGQVVRFSDASIASESTAGWLVASRITHQEDPDLLDAISHKLQSYVHNN